MPNTVFEDGCQRNFEGEDKACLPWNADSLSPIGEHKTVLSFREYDIDVFKGEEDMVIFDIGLSFGIGALFKRVEKRKSLTPSLATASLGIAPAALAFLHLYPDWDLQYLIPKEALPPWFAAVFVFTLVGASLGIFTQAKWKQTGFVFGGLYTVYCLWSLTRLFEVTSYREFHAGTEAEFPMAFLGYLGCLAHSHVLYSCCLCVGHSNHRSNTTLDSFFSANPQVHETDSLRICA